eukprot:2604054-Amphidinium_carterae.3
MTEQVYTENLVSNLSLLLQGLRDLGYVAPRALLNPLARIEACRRRAWLPCYRWDSLPPEERIQMEVLSMELLEQLSETANPQARSCKTNRKP